MHVGARSGLFALVLAAAALAGSGACSSDPESSNPPQIEAGVPPEQLCVDGKAAWPSEPYAITLLGTLPPDLAFESPDGTVRIADFYEPCAARSRILVVRTSAAWCGTCDWHVKHTKRLFDDPRFAERLLLVDLLLADEDNMPADLEAVARWKARIDTPGKVALDLKHTFSPAFRPNVPLPEYLLIDTRTMKVLNVVEAPDPETLQNRIVLELAELDKLPRPTLAIPKLYDDLLTEDQWDIVKGMKLVASPPPDPTNEYADSTSASDLGKKLFSDVLLSPTNNLACSTCHAEGTFFADATGQSTGLARVDRNSPSVLLASHSRWQFWDGRADTLWMQALGPPENAKEIGSSRLYIAHQIATRYAAEYNAVFGAKYPLPDLSALPPNGKPGEAAYDTMTLANKEAVTRIYVNVGKAIAAFERSLRVKPNALDRYIDGEKNALTPEQKQALLGFMKGGCPQCHWGPNLTDDAFHALRFPTGKQDGTADRGRIDVLPSLAASEFVATSAWSDSPSSAKKLLLGSAPSMLGAFKTPPLRGTAQTGPYGHGGTLPTLLDVTKHYGMRAEHVLPNQAIGDVEPWVPLFDETLQTLLPKFLEVLTADPQP